MNKYMILGAAAAVALAGVPASAAVTIQLYNTGTDAAGNALADIGATDTHYQIFASDHAEYVGNQAVTYRNGGWLANDGDSAWISLSSNGTPVNGTTTYRLTFDLTGLDHNSATISGDWGVDNNGWIFLNGSDTGFFLDGTQYSSFQALHAFTLSSGFIAGLNTLDFVVEDEGVVTGLRVDNLIGSANAIPEPASWALMVGGFAMLGLALRRRPAARVSFS